MIARYNKISLAVGVPGLILQIVGMILDAKADVLDAPAEQTAMVSSLLVVVGSIGLLIGLAFFAKAKGRSPAWGLLGLLSWVGLIILYFMKDKAVPPVDIAWSDDNKSR